MSEIRVKREIPEGYWVCACTKRKRTKAGGFFIKMNSPSIKRCPVCKMSPIVETARGIF